MKKYFSALCATLLALFASCSSDAPEAIIDTPSADEAVVSFGINLTSSEGALSRANTTPTPIVPDEYYVAISPEAAADGKISSGWIGRFSSLDDVSIALKKKQNYNFYITAFLDLSEDKDQLTDNTLQLDGDFQKVTTATAIAPDYANLEVDRYYGSTSKTISVNEKISITGTRYAYGISVQIAPPAEGSVKLAFDTPTLSYEVTSGGTEAFKDEKVFCMGGFNTKAEHETQATLTILDANGKTVGNPIVKKVKIKCGYYKTFIVNAMDAVIDFDFPITEQPLTKDDDDVVMDPETELGTPYITFSAAAEQSVTLTLEVPSMEYTVGGSEWATLAANTPITFGGSYGTMQVRAREAKGTFHVDDYLAARTAGQDPLLQDYAPRFAFSKADVPVECMGDIRTLIDYKDYKTVATNEACFILLFAGKDVNNPSPIVSAPKLPITDLAEHAYICMFTCSNIVEAPELPATTMTTECYAEMFGYCKQLTKAPVLPAESLADKCYELMFNNCTKLTSVTMLATNISFTDCLKNWLQGVPSSGTFIKNSAAVWDEADVIPSGWTVQTASE